MIIESLILAYLIAGICKLVMESFRIRFIISNFEEEMLKYISYSDLNNLGDSEIQVLKVISLSLMIASIIFLWPITR